MVALKLPEENSFNEIFLAEEKQISIVSFSILQSLVVPNAPFLLLLKTCFQGVEKGCIGYEWVKTVIRHCKKNLTTVSETW